MPGYMQLYIVHLKQFSVVQSDIILPHSIISLLLLPGWMEAIFGFWHCKITDDLAKIDFERWSGSAETNNRTRE